MPRTIAFSHKGGFWKTRYSFYSYCYAFIDRLFFSFNQAFGRQPIWEHNSEITARTNFYGAAGGSSIAVSFNDKPSRNKIYKSLSLESTNNVEGLSVLTVNDSTVANQTVNPAASILTERGGILYGSVGFDTRLTGANVKLMGVVQGNQFSGGVNIVSIQFVDGGLAYNFDQDGDTKYFFANIQDNPAGTTTTTNFQFNVADQIGIQTYDGIPADLSLAPLVGQESIGTNVIYLSGGEITLPGAGNVYLYSVTPGNINGEQARGHTVNAVLTLGAADYELYALNLEYEATDYDHRETAVTPQRSRRRRSGNQRRRRQ